MLEAKRSPYVELIPDDALVETSTEPFDRVAFAQRAVALLRPPRTRIAICEGVARIRVEAGRQWGASAGSRWAIVSVPPTASRRAIALAVAGLGGATTAPAYALDVLLGEHEANAAE